MFAKATEARPAARLLCPARGERYRATTVPRALETGNTHLIEDLGTADGGSPLSVSATATAKAQISTRRREDINGGTRDMLELSLD